ncbi:MAG: hypothetical protein WAJ85_07605 [Candidatus Baltobacteraceae bacterium]|jgi:hypothetical protein
MRALKEHFVDKYFGYRRGYVDYILGAVPKRAPLAVLSELVRLAFVVVTSGLCAVIFWLLTAGALQRGGKPGAWLWLFIPSALAASSFVLLALRGIVEAARDRRRVLERARR